MGWGEKGDYLRDTVVEESVILLSDMLGLIFVRVICSNLRVICAPIFSKYCGVFLETYCVV